MTVSIKKRQSKTLNDLLLRFPFSSVTDSELALHLDGSAHQRYGLLKRAAARGDLIPLRRSLYAIPQKYTGKPPNLYELSQKIYGPSYVSFESAMAYHGLIPEAVHTTTCASAKRNKEFQTPLGLFSYERLPADHLYLGVNIVQTGTDVFFMARPWKAIADYVYAKKKEWTGMTPLIESLRMDRELLLPDDETPFDALIDYYRSRRVSRFLRGIKKEFRK